MSAIKVWGNVENGFYIKYMDNNKWKKQTSWKTVYNRISSSNIFQNPKNALQKKEKIIIKNNLQ